MSGITTDMLRQTVVSLIEITRQICAVVENGEFSSLEELLERRARLLEQQSVLITHWKDSPRYADNKERDLLRLKPLTDMLHQSDQHLNRLVLQKKEEIAEQLRQAQNERRLLAYSC